jgi:hypothetical protein
VVFEIQDEFQGVHDVVEELPSQIREESAEDSKTQDPNPADGASYGPGFLVVHDSGFAPSCKGVHHDKYVPLVVQGSYICIGSVVVEGSLNRAYEIRRDSFHRLSDR